MKKTLILLSIILVVFLLSTVSLYHYSGLSTKVITTIYSLEGITNGNHDDYDFVLAAKSTQEYIKAEDSDLDYDKNIYKDPYNYSLWIYGNFDRVEDVILSIKLDNGETISPKITDAEMNHKVGYSDYLKMKEFKSNKYELDFDVQKVVKFYVTVTFKVIEDGRSKNIEITKEYEVVKQERESTRFIRMMPSV